MLEPDELTLFALRFEEVGAPYMITGATAAILYGQPRVTNDLDVVLALDDSRRPAFLEAFPEPDFYVPPESVIQAEQARAQRGHFKVIHLESGYKADIYLVCADPLHAWALPRRRRIQWADRLEVSVAPSEYVILRKLEYFRQGESSKHRTDIQAILRSTTVDENELRVWIVRLGLSGPWEGVHKLSEESAYCFAPSSGSHSTRSSQRSELVRERPALSKRRGHSTGRSVSSPAWPTGGSRPGDAVVWLHQLSIRGI